MSDYHGISQQRKNILEIIKKFGCVAANDITAKDPTIKNVHEQLNRLTTDGFIKRVGERTYSLTEKGKNVFEKKKETTTDVHVRFTEEEIKNFKEFSKEKNFENKLAEMLNPTLLGLQNERLACLLAMISNNDEQGDRNRITTLYTGEPSTGKTQIIRWAQQFLWGYWSDGETKKAGLQGTGKGYQFTEGMLQKSDNNTLFIDEIDKLEKKSQSALLSAIELGMATIIKDGVKKTTNTRIRIVATCNQKDRLIEELRSRFDLQFHINRLTEEEKTSLVIKKTNDWNRKKVLGETNDYLQRYLMYANQQETTFPEDREWINNILLHELKYGKLQGKEPRKIEAIYRLSLAISKLRLKKEVTKEELKKAIEIIDETGE